MDQKISVDGLETASLTCPHCKETHLLLLAGYALPKRYNPIRYHCGCGRHDRAILEKQFDPRPCKGKGLAGTFRHTGPAPKSGKMTVLKVNEHGITLKTCQDHSILPGCALNLEFVLDDPKQSIVKRKVRVQACHGRYLTARFPHCDRADALGPYLLSPVPTPAPDGLRDGSAWANGPGDDILPAIQGQRI